MRTIIEPGKSTYPTIPAALDFGEVARRMVFLLPRVNMDSERDLVDELIAEGKRFNWVNFCQSDSGYRGKYGGHDTPEWLAWKMRSVNTVTRICSDTSPATKLANKGARVRTNGFPLGNFENAHSQLLKALELTRSMLDSDVYGERRGPESTHPSPALSNRVFVVHGHDSELKNDVERFLHEIGLEPVVLHRQPDQGKTIVTAHPVFASV